MPGLSGMGMMLKGMGFDPEEMKMQAEQFMAMMQAGVAKINANQVQLEATQARIEAKLDRAIEILESTTGSTTPILDDQGKPTGALLTTEKFPQAMLDDAGYQPEANVIGKDK